MNFRMIFMGPDGDPELQRPAMSQRSSLAGNYIRCGPAMARKHLRNGRETLTFVANFHARIVCDRVLEGHPESRRDFEIEAVLDGQRTAFVVSAAEFGGMAWVLRHLGPGAIIYPGQQQHARAAIQFLSGAVPQKRIFSHLGWSKTGTDWVYLQSKIAVGASGLACDVTVELPEALQAYQVQTAVDSQERKTAVRASLKLLSLVPDRIGIPLLASVYRAPLGNLDFSVFLTGRSGTFKTALAALCQQHFGAAMDAAHLPAHFGSTANALELLAFSAKDALLVIDDFVPKGGSGDSALQATAERIFRSAGNHQGRSRMGGGGRLDPPKPPRALVLASGEEVPQGQSVRTRLLIVEVHPGDVDLKTLSACQCDAREGRSALARGAFISWIAGRYDELQTNLRARIPEIRSEIQGHVVHARLSSAVAELRAGWEIFLNFALEVGAIGEEENVQLLKRSERAFAELAATQIPYYEASDPALRFLALVRAALVGGRAHLLSRFGRMPENPGVWGWREQSGSDWIPQGCCIGWVHGSDVFLDPTASYQLAQVLAGSEPIAVGEQTLRQRLHAAGVLASIDTGRQTLTVRRTLQECPRQLLHFKIRSIRG